METDLDLKKRYWVFAFDVYYPGGGLEDLEATFDDISEAREYMRENVSKVDVIQILDIVERKVFR